MQINSIEFIFCFLPIFLMVFYCVRQELQTPVLVISGLVFYYLSGGGNLWWVGLLVAVTLLTYYIQRLLGEYRSGLILVLTLVLLVGILMFFKLWEGGRNLPAGMSFYMFQIAAILIDTFRGRVRTEKRILRYFEQVVLFPKLLSGPIVNPLRLRRQAVERAQSAVLFRSGLQLLILGLALKVLLANRLGGLWAQPINMGYDSISTPAAWLAIVAYTMKLYLDFFGYSLMAVGLGRMIGYDLPHNFVDPYASKSVSEFFRRWHATLGAWFKEYVYIPLGGNRKGLLRTILNMAVVWLLTGLWHGVGGNYMIWAGFIFLLIVNERLWLGKLLNRSRVLCHVYVVVMIVISWIPFAIGGWNEMVVFCGKLIGIGPEPQNPLDFVEWIKMYAGLLAVSAFLMTPIPRKIWHRVRDSVLADLVLIVLFWFVVFYIATAAQDPFMYFQY